MNMWVTIILGCLLSCAMLHLSVAKHCQALDSDDSAFYPLYPLSFEDLRFKVLDGERTSRTYYEVYSLDPTALKPAGLPVLRKVAIRWNWVAGVFPGNFTNDYTGWAFYRPANDSCEDGLIVFETIIRKDMLLSFKFESVFPTVENFIGTSFSSCPERYLINWYCPEKEVVYGGKKSSYIKWCKSGTRMSIYSSTGPNNMPWHQIVEDLCDNNAPKMDDKRWTMTYDAPLQCEITDGGGRKKRSTDVRHYL